MIRNVKYKNLGRACVRVCVCACEVSFVDQGFIIGFIVSFNVTASGDISFIFLSFFFQIK